MRENSEVHTRQNIRYILISLISSIFVVGVVYAVGDEKPYAETAVKAPEAIRGGYVEPKISHEPYGVMKIVVPITTDDKAIQGMKLPNIENSLDSATKWGRQDAEHGRALRQGRVVRDIVPSDFAEVAYLQSKKNYVVDPVN